MNQEQFNQELIDFLNASPTPFHATACIAGQLSDAGFQALDESDTWSLKQGGKYYVTRNDSSIIAFTLGNIDQGFRMMGAHTDSPCPKVKPLPEMTRHRYLQLGVETYGGMLLNTWFDRDLSLAGRIQYIDNSHQLRSSLINFKKPIAIIPSLAIHLDREANKNRSINPQTDIPPILCQLPAGEKASLHDILIEQLKAEGINDCQQIIEYDLSFYDTQSAAIIGLKDDFIASARLDNLLSCFTGMRALMDHQPGDATALLVCNDHEEVGSLSTTGAQGPFLKSVLERITGTGEPLARAINNSMLISADNAHGVHPNFADKHDGNHQPLLNEGAVIKVNANQRYASTDQTAAIYQCLCKETGNKVQHFVTRTDLACGSTIGPLTSGQLGVRTLDLGLPTFGMHSVRELAGTQDAYAMAKTLEKFFELNQLPL